LWYTDLPTCRSQPLSSDAASNCNMRGAFTKVREEVREILVIAIFFSTGFCLIDLSDRLLTRGSGIEIASFARALVGGLIVAKVLLIVDLLPFVHRFPEKPLIQNIVWKSSLYLAASLVFLYCEALIKHLFKGLGLAQSHSLALMKFALPATWAVEIWLAMLLVAFVTMQELSHVIGREQLKQLFFGRHGKPVAKGRLAA
jgi:hypothetical protein